MKRGIVREGFALITAVVISAAILATIVGIATLTVRETRVQAEQNLSDQALAVAERGLADVVSRFKTDKTPFVTDFIKNYDVNRVWELPPSSGTVSAGGHAFYWVKVKVLQKGTAANPEGKYEVYAAGFIAGESVSGKSSEQLKALAADRTKVLARRVVQLTAEGNVDVTLGTLGSPGSPAIPGSPGSPEIPAIPAIPPSPPDGTSAFDYGLFTGVNFEMSGSKNLANLSTGGTSGIYAAGNIEPITGSPTFSDLQLYAEGSIDKDVAKMLAGSSEVHPGYNVSPKPTFPDLNFEEYMDWFDAFVAGTAPFDGSKAGYPDLSNATVRSAVLAALGNPENNNVTVDGQSHHFVTPTALSSYTNQVVSGSFVKSVMSTVPVEAIPALIALPSTLSKSVFYVRTSVTDPNVTWQSNREYLAGVIVSSGNIKFTGCPDFAQGQVAAFLAHGVIDLAGSTAQDTPARGIFYAEGWDESKQKFLDKAVLYTGSGWFEGQVISKSTVDWAGSGNIKFKDYSSMLGALIPGGSDGTRAVPAVPAVPAGTDVPAVPAVPATPDVINGFTSFSQGVSGWTEKAWAEFLALITS